MTVSPNYGLQLRQTVTSGYPNPPEVQMKMLYASWSEDGRRRFAINLRKELAV
jgi:hypothetical protein